MNIRVTLTEKSRAQELNMQNIPFGKHFSDHMLIAIYENGQWGTPEIKPFQPLSLSPANAAIHYGQSIFEGIKAYRHADGSSHIFRPYDNYRRFNASAARLQMPAVPEDIFIEGMRRLIDLDRNWIPGFADHSLYVRPFMFAMDDTIGVKPSESYAFMIILSPTGPYYAAPMKIYVEEYFVRAVPGGIGFAKAAGNYAAAMHATAEAKKKGYDQVLWMDAIEHKYVQECGTMNVFFIFEGEAVTPDLKEGTILAGVTRDSVIEVLQDMGLKVSERPISIDEIISSYQSGKLKEVFGTGTAATISLIRELGYKDIKMDFDIKQWEIAPRVKQLLSDIREGKAADTKKWLFKV
ncbi:MAG: branched-chain amino acid aminotransferase [Bacteroidetes bacterium]|nr:branched-chain amino acid aminotransferase [Bacteroidota bacterium]